MHVLYACDDKFVWLMGTSMISLFENNKRIKDLDVYVIGKELSEKSRNELILLGDKYSRNIEILDFPALNIPETLCSERWPLISFARLFAAELLPDTIDKALYLDSDTIVCGDISALDDIEMEDNIFCGVRDCIGEKYRRNIGLTKDDLYINAGVILLNIKKLRSMDVRPYLEKTAWEYKDFITYADQDLLNTSFKGYIGEIPPKYNIMTIVASYSLNRIEKLRRPEMYYTAEELEEAKKDPRIIHYTTNMLTVRPWYQNTNHPYAEEFIKCLAISPWEDRDLTQMKFSGKKHKIMKLLSFLPTTISDRTLGFLHAEIRPQIAKLKAKRIIHG